MNVRRVALICLSVLALSACGGKSEAEKKKEQGLTAESSAVCDKSGFSGSTGLPANFPEPDGVTYRDASSAGPSKVVDATYDGDLDAAYDAYQEEIDKAGYDVLFKEKEEDDAEISYKGEGTTGQIALRNVCGESDKLVVHITNRPQ